MYCSTWLIMINRHGVFLVLHIWHDPSCGIIVNCNIYLTLSLHDVLHAVRKITMLGTKLLHMIFLIYICEKSLLSWTWYPQSVHSHLITRFITLQWSKNPCAHVGYEICFWNSFVKLVSVFSFEVCIAICDS